jgi:signal recognition particle subunit SRP54
MGQQMDQMQMSGDEFKRMEAMINSMTPAEREDPEMIEASRRRRIARGSGAEPQDVSGLIKSFSMAANMMKQMAGMGMRDRMKFASQMGQMGMAGGQPQFKVKQRSKRLSSKERRKRRKKRKNKR